MDAKALILEIFREADFISETLSQKSAERQALRSPELLSASAIKKACGAFLNGRPDSSCGRISAEAGAKQLRGNGDMG